MGTGDSFDLLFSVEDLTEEELEIQIEYIEKLIRKGLTQGHPFALLEAENRLRTIGRMIPRFEVAEVVLKSLEGPTYGLNFDVIRLCGYLKNDRIREALEKHFTDLKDIWREQDELRLYESHKMILENVARRADELSALRIIADPYMKTLDEFFNRHFNEKKLQRFPHLVKVHKDLLDMRKRGLLTKDNILAVLNAAKARINTFVERRSAELAKIHGQAHIKPNRLIAIYYCLLEALMCLESPIIKIDKEFLEKVGQDFRASYGDGTKRFVLNSLLQLKNDSFAEIAAEARYTVKSAVVEKMERKEAGQPVFRTMKVSLREFQNFNLYKTASQVIALNPVPDVIRSLMYSYLPSAVLLGLRALDDADLPPNEKIAHLKVTFDLGTMDAYVFTRAIRNLSTMNTPAAAAMLARVLVQRYCWRKARVPEQALAMIQQGIYGAVGSGSISALASVLGGTDGFYTKGVEATYPYEGMVYDAVFDRLAMRFERNLFHGINEIAQHRLFRALMFFVFNTRLNFATRGKRRALAAIRTLHQVSNERLGAMVGEMKERISSFEKEVVSSATEGDRAIARDILTDARNTQTALAQIRAQPPEEEKVLRDILESLSRYYRGDRDNITLQMRIKRTLKQLLELGYLRMKKRDKNVLSGKERDDSPDTAMLSVRYPAADSTVIKAAPLFMLYSQWVEDEFVVRVIESLGVTRLAAPPEAPESPSSVEETEKSWEKLKQALHRILLPKEAQEFREDVFLITHSAAAHRMEHLMDDMYGYIYENRQPPVLRFAHLVALPLEEDFAQRWSFLLSSEDDTVFLALATHLNKDKRARLRELVPDILDLLG